MRLNPPQVIALEYPQTAAGAQGGPSSQAARRSLRTLVLLDGALRPSPLVAAVGRSVLDLPISQERSLLTLWQEQARELARALGAQLHCRIVVSEHCQAPEAPADDPLVRFTVERDPAPLRGTGGLLRDLVTGYGDDDALLAAPAAQILVEPLAPIIISALLAPGYVKMLVTGANGNGGAPTNVYLFSPRAFRGTAAVGYVDLKEQVLPSIALRHEIVVVTHRRPLGLPVRTPQSYLAALQAHHLVACGSSAATDPLAERWQSSFRVVEAGAEVHPSARVSNSVVLKGARIASDVLLANCIVCGGASVPRGTVLIDKLITRGGVMPISAA